ncbi:MAG: hypothetical protein WCJ33_03690 [Pseudomonadota bacterium]
MPQLDPASFSSQLLWLTIFFVMMYVVLARSILPRIENILVTRSGKIADDIANAEKMKNEAERVRDEYEIALSQIRVKSKEIITATQARISELNSKKESELAVQIEKKISDSEFAIKKAKEAVMVNITPFVSNISSLLISKLINYTPEISELDKSVNKITKESVI